MVGKTSKRHEFAHGKSDTIRIVRPQTKLPQKSVDYLRRYAANAVNGGIRGFAICAVGDDFSVWYGYRALSRQDRMTLLGQLQMLIRDITEEEESSQT